MDSAEIHRAVATAIEHQRAGRPRQAEAIYQQILAADPNQPDVLHYLGVLAYHAGRNDLAIEMIRRSISLKSGNASAHINLGNVWLVLGRAGEAATEYRRGLELNPSSADGHNNLAMALLHQGRFAESADECRQAIQCRPDYADAFNNLGAALRELNQLDEAAAAYRRAIELNPKDAKYHNNLGVVRADQGLQDLALECYARAVELNPVDPALHSNRVYATHIHPDFDAARILAEHRRWDQVHGLPLRPFIPVHQNDPSPDRRLRIGYVSPDFRIHPVGRFLLPLVESHDHEKFEIYGYSDVRIADDLTDKIARCIDVKRTIRGLSHAQAAELIFNDRIDILVDLTMHMTDNRLPMFARKPAPVQVTYLAYCSTTGLSAIDYRLTDIHIDPPGTHDSDYGEQSLRLPRTYWCYVPGVATVEPNDPPSAAAGHVTFGCLNNFSKVTGDALNLWAQVLKAVPHSRLLLHARLGEHQHRVRQVLCDQGIDPARLEFIGRLPPPEYFRGYHRIDIALDPIPHAGGTTTCDAIWMGVPVVTLSGRTAVGRGGVSILSNVGLQECIAGSHDEYIQIAARLAGDQQDLNQLRHTLRDRMRRSPLMDARQFARDIENAYRFMWHRWCAEA